VALVHDDRVEEGGGVFAVQAGVGFVLCDGLVGGEVHLPALDRLAILDLPPARLVEEGLQQRVGDGLGEPLADLVACPQFVGGGEAVEKLLLPREGVALEDVGAVGGVGELQAEYAA
jgi:hypothetical protein